MEKDIASAKIKYLRISARKMRPIITLVRGKKVGEAKEILSVLPQKGAKLASAAIDSAIANAKQKNLNADDLYILSIISNQGPPFKRMRPWSRGVGRPVRKKTAHIEVVLGKLGKKKARGKISKKAVTAIKKVAKKVARKPKELIKKEPKSGTKSTSGRSATKN
jgi:large subunit ribosomal protein L22